MLVEERIILFDRIINGKTIMSFDGFLYCIHDPQPQDRIKTHEFYEVAYQHLLDLGVSTQEELLAILIEKGIWSKDKDEQIKQYKEEIKNIGKELPRYEFQSNTKATLLSKLDILKKEIDKLNSVRNNLLTKSAEYLANLERYRRFLFFLTYDKHTKRVWQNWDSFNKADDSLLNKLMMRSFFDPHITEKNLRDLARNDPWRPLWLVASKTGNLFPYPITQCTEYQRALLSWSLIYDNVYESMECPTTEIINNDALLDEWLEQQSEKRDADKNKRQADSRFSHVKGQEIGIMVDTPQDAKKVFAMNDPLTQSVLKSREQLIKTKGRVVDADFGDVKVQLMMKKNELAMQSVKQRTK